MDNENVTLAKLTGWTVTLSPKDGKWMLWTPDNHILLSGHQTEASAWQYAPKFTSSLDAHAKYAWPVIKNEGLWYEYMVALNEINKSGDHWFTSLHSITAAEQASYWMVSTLPEQHTRAAIKCLGGK